MDLIEDNRDAAQIYGICKRQVITAGEGNEIIDLNYTAIKIMMDLYGVEKQRECFEKVTKTFHHFLNMEKTSGE